MVSSRSPVAFVFATMTQTVGWAKARAQGLSAHEVADTRRAHHLRAFRKDLWWARCCAVRVVRLCAWIAPLPTLQANSIQRPIRLRLQVRRREQIVRKLAARRNPDLVLILLHVADHLLERGRDVRPSAELRMHDHVHGAGAPAQAFLENEIERGPE